MPKLPSSLVAMLFVACVAAGGQGARPRSETDRRRDRAPLVFLDSTREGDGLKGPVRRVETEITRVELKGGELVPKSRHLLERTLYDERGRRAANETYPVAGGPVGQETHRYDAQGNLAETVVRDPGGAVLSRIAYDYEFDQFGNWVKMTASVAVLSSGKVEYEPTEITKRTITYYLTDETDHRPAAGEAPESGWAPPKLSGLPRATPVADEGETVSASSSPGGEVMDVGVLNERATEIPKPAYPVSRRRLNEPITVAVEVVVDITGRVLTPKAQGGPAELREAAESAARRAVFLPFYVAGRPVKARGRINYAFNFLP